MSNANTAFPPATSGPDATDATNAPHVSDATGASDALVMQRHVAPAAALLRSLANEQRLLILCHLVREELGVGTLLARLDLSQSALSQHLAVLRDAGIVTPRREGQQVFYALAPGPAQAVMSTLHAIYCHEETT